MRSSLDIFFWFCTRLLPFWHQNALGYMDVYRFVAKYVDVLNQRFERNPWIIVPTSLILGDCQRLRFLKGDWMDRLEHIVVIIRESVVDYVILSVLKSAGEDGERNGSGRLLLEFWRASFMF